MNTIRIVGHRDAAASPEQSLRTAFQLQRIAAKLARRLPPRGLTYAEAAAGALEETVEGIRIPYPGLRDLIRSKQTSREKDRFDIEMLVKRSPGAAAWWEKQQTGVKGCSFLLPVGLAEWLSR